MIPTEAERGSEGGSSSYLNSLQKLVGRCTSLLAASYSPARQNFTAVSQFDGAIMAIAIADAYVLQEDEQKFGLNPEFFSFFGKLCSILPTGESAVVDVPAYERTKRNVIEKFVLRMEGEVNEEEDPEVVELVNWISQKKDRSIFFKWILEAEDSGDRDPEIDLRWKFGDVLKKSNNKFFSLHPEIQEQEDAEIAKIIEVREEQRRLEEERKSQEDTPEIPVAGPSSSESAKYGEIFSGSDLEWLVEQYKAKVPEIIVDCEQAHEHALDAGLPVLYSDADRITALLNWEHYKNFRNLTIEKSRNLTVEEFRLTRNKIAKILKQRRRKEVPETQEPQTGSISVA